MIKIKLSKSFLPGATFLLTWVNFDTSMDKRSHAQ